MKGLPLLFVSAVMARRWNITLVSQAEIFIAVCLSDSHGSGLYVGTYDSRIVATAMDEVVVY